MENIFLKIINREIPANIIYEDDLVIAFLDIVPVNKGHALVVPKKHFVNILDGDPDTLAHMMKISQKIAKAQVKELGAEGFNLVVNNGIAGGQEVMHSHFHVVPRYLGDNAYQKPSHVECSKEEFVAIREKLAGVIN
ncbi:MAG: HIT family protein [Candidatus Pacebacteria bacterium]|nr:HIT family protein [Candidatus Paceibacterota bacterium]